MITDSTGTRSGYANLLANLDMTLHLKQRVRARPSARATPITDDAERRGVLSRIKAEAAFGQHRSMAVDRWVKGSCLVEITSGGPLQTRRYVSWTKR